MYFYIIIITYYLAKILLLRGTFNVNVTDGSLDLDFLSSVNLAKISAIEIGVVRGDRPYTERSLYFYLSSGKRPSLLVTGRGV